MKPAPTIPAPFSADCVLCPRLASYLAGVRAKYPEYYARPVPSFGDPDARFLIAGLAPGLHGANATGRPFTGDHAGIILYETLYRHGFATAPVSVSADDDLRLVDCIISNSVRCLPPANKPLPVEIRECNRYLAFDLARLPQDAVILAMGRIAHEAVLMALGLRRSAHVFAHGRWHELDAGPAGLAMIDTYHCSRYNTQTRRLTPEMFDAVFAAVRARLDSSRKAASPSVP